MVFTPAGYSVVGEWVQRAGSTGEMGRAPLGCGARVNRSQRGRGGIARDCGPSLYCSACGGKAGVMGKKAKKLGSDRPGGLSYVAQEAAGGAEFGEDAFGG